MYKKSFFGLAAVVCLAAVLISCPIVEETEPTYIVKFDPNGGAGALQSQTITYGSSLGLRSIEDIGYEPPDALFFAGWAESRTGNIIYGDAEVVHDLTQKESITLYARWGYLVDFNTLGGSVTGGSIIKEQLVLPKDKVIRPSNNPARAGFNFINWYVDNPQTNPSAEIYNFSASVESSFTLYAKWNEIIEGIINCTVTFDSSNGGTPPSPLTVDYNADIYLPGAGSMERAGYTFTGWYIEKDGEKISYAENAAYRATANVTMFAQWIDAFTVAFDLNGGAGKVPVSQTGKANSQFKLPDQDGFAKTGYRFDGWSPDNSTETSVLLGPGDNYKITGNGTLYAVWSAISYTIRYNKNSDDAEGEMENTRSCSYDVSRILSGIDFTRTGWTFTGWNEKSDGSGLYTYEDQESVKNLTTTHGSIVNLYAQWKANVLSIAYANGGGTGDAPATPVSAAYGTNVTMPGNSYTRAGWTFAGWIVSGTGAVANTYAAGAAIPAANLSSAIKAGNAAITLTAAWNRNMLVIDYAPGGATGSAPANPASAYYGESITMPKNTYIRGGWTFTGWEVSGSNSIAGIYQEDQVVAVEALSKAIAGGSAGITLNATWSQVVLRQQAIAFADSSVTKTYGDEIFSIGLGSEGDGTGAVNFASSDTNVAIVNTVGAQAQINILRAGTVVITANKESDAAYLAATASFTLTVNRKSVSISGVTVADKTYDGNTDARASGGSISGMVEGDSLGFTAGTAVFSDKNAGTKTVAFNSYILSGNDKDNYSLSPMANTTAKIIAKPVSITGLTVSNKTYDGGVTATSSNGSVDGVISGETVSFNRGTASFADKNAGTGKTVSFSGFSLSGTAASNYSLSGQPVSVAANITAKPITLTVTAPAALSPLATTAAFNVHSTGFIANDSPLLTVTVAGLSTYGLTVSGNSAAISNSAKAVTLTYNGTTAVTSAAAYNLELAISNNANYSLSGTSNVSVAICDGQAEASAIPVSAANLAAFNTYASSSAGRARHFKLAENITLPASWAPIGSATYPFTGSFDGDGKTVYMGTQNYTSTTFAGLFGVIGSGGTVKDLRINGTLSSTWYGNVIYTGAVAGRSSGTIRNISSNVRVSSENSGTGTLPSIAAKENFTGGIVGHLQGGTVENCYNTGDVTVFYGGRGSLGYGGGIAGAMEGAAAIRYCIASGNIKSASQDVGGIVGLTIGSTAKSITGCAALQKKILQAHWYMNRIAGNYESGGLAFTNNYANSEMQLNGNILKAMWGGGSTAISATGRNGGNIYPEYVLDAAFWQTSLGWTTAVNWDSSWTSSNPNKNRPWHMGSTHPILWFESSPNLFTPPSDTTPPTVPDGTAVTYQADTDSEGDNYTIAWNLATDNTTPDTLLIYYVYYGTGSTAARATADLKENLDNGNYVTMGICNDFAGRYYTDDLGVGRHNFTVIVEDEYGNQTQYGSTSINLSRKKYTVVDFPVIIKP